jgi:hypothetical protein
MKAWLRLRGRCAEVDNVESVTLTDTGEPVRLTDAGNAERRRNRATLAFVLLAFVSSGAGYLAYEAGKSATGNLQAAGRDATTKSCLSGLDLRIAVAAALDDLRQLAVSGAPQMRRDQFIAVTQPSIDRLLSQAAGHEFHAPLPPGKVSAIVADQVRGFGVQRCQERTAATFDTKPAGG